MPVQSKAIVVGISGPSSSGKTTLARLLRDAFPNTGILHQDDFYKPDSDIPMHPTAGVADWDCLDALDVPALEKVLSYVREHGTPPPDLVSKEDKNAVGEVAVDKRVVEDLKWRAGKWMFQDVPPIIILDGFLLYSEEMRAVRELLDVRIFLRASYATAKARREQRTGYVTVEGFWEDPPGYVDDVVWPNYVKDHAFMFEGGDVEGAYKRDVLETNGIEAMPQASEVDMTSCLEWAYHVIEGALERFKVS